MLPVRKEVDPAFEAVEKLFNLWRREKKRRDPIPPLLREAALSLTDRYPVYAIAKRLRLNYADFRALAESRPARTAPAFIELGPLGVTVEMTKPSGEKMKIAGACNAAELARMFLE